jgi:hypothetical protein
MGGAFSTSKPKPAAGEEGGESAVVAVHSKAKWDELWDAHKNTTKLVLINIRPPFHNVKLFSIARIRIDVYKFKYIYMSRFINI